MRLLFYDFETSGLNSKKDSVLSFAYAIYDDHEDKIIKYDSFNIAHEKLRISKGAYEVNKITLDDIFNPSNEKEERILLEINKALGYSISGIAGYNIVRFDNLFLTELMDKYKNIELPEFKSYDVIDLARTHLTLKSYTLSNVCKHLGIPIIPHNALGDVLATIEVYKRVRDAEDN